MATSGNVNHDGEHAAAKAASASSNAAANGGHASNELPVQDLGEHFTKLFYTTMNQSPEKLHLFYNKSSQYVCGEELQSAWLHVGRPSIQERIKELNFVDCKVRITSVDSMHSGEQIVIQVIGELSNNGQESKKFVETFVLAKQPSGYFVLNDILRFIVDDFEDEAVKDAVAPGPEACEAASLVKEVVDEPAEQIKPAVKAPSEVTLENTNKTLEEVEPRESPSGSVVDMPAEGETEAIAETVGSLDAEENTPIPAPSEANTDAVEKPAETVEEEKLKPEFPKEPTPTPVAQPRTAPPPASARPAASEKPKESPKPMTWASRAAAAAGPPRPIVPALPKAATPAVPPQSRVPAPSQSQQPVATYQSAPATSVPAESAAAAKTQDSEWETAPSKRGVRPQSISGTVDKETPMAYIKYVTETVQTEDLKNMLSKFGELAYFDINRQKNCAFVEFTTQAGYNAAVAANPHLVNGEKIFVEQRRPKLPFGPPYNNSRGGVNGARRGGYDGARSVSQGGGRGGFTGASRGRGGGGAHRGRGTAQTSNA